MLQPRDIVVYPPRYIREHCIRMQYHELLVKFRTRAQTVKEFVRVRASSIIRLRFNRQLDGIEWFWHLLWQVVYQLCSLLW